jgi:hypothetical protein
VAGSSQLWPQQKIGSSLSFECIQSGVGGRQGMALLALLTCTVRCQGTVSRWQLVRCTRLTAGKHAALFALRAL